jgi:hypothetical protein
VIARRPTSVAPPCLLYKRLRLCSTRNRMNTFGATPRAGQQKKPRLSAQPGLPRKAEGRKRLPSNRHWLAKRKSGTGKLPTLHTRDLAPRLEQVAVLLKTPQVPLEIAKRHLCAQRIGPGGSQTNDKTYLLLHHATSFEDKFLGAAEVVVVIPGQPPAPSRSRRIAIEYMTTA